MKKRGIVIALFAIVVGIVFMPSTSQTANAASTSVYTFDYLVLENTVETGWTESWTNWFEIRLYQGGQKANKKIHRHTNSNKISSGGALDFYPTIVIEIRNADYVYETFRPGVLQKYEGKTRTNELRYYVGSTLTNTFTEPFSSSYSHFWTVIDNCDAYMPTSQITRPDINTGISGEGYEGTHKIELEFSMAGVRSSGTQVAHEDPRTYKKAFSFTVTLDKPSASVESGTISDNISYLPYNASSAVIAKMTNYTSSMAGAHFSQSNTYDTNLTASTIEDNTLTTVKVMDWSENYVREVGKFYKDTRRPRITNMTDVYNSFYGTGLLTIEMRDEIAKEVAESRKTFDLGFSKKDVSFSFGAENNSAPQSAVLKTWLRFGTTSTSASYNSGDTISASGKYELTVTDISGNKLILVFSIDKSNPSNNTLDSFTNKAIEYIPSDDNIIAKVFYRKGATGSYTSVEAATYTVSASEANNGIWYFYAEDQVGNVTSIINCTLDTVSPVIASTPPSYSKTDISFKVTDTNLYRVYWKYEGETAYSYTTNNTATISANSSNNKKWYFYAEDLAGNKTSEVTSTIDTILPTNIALPQFTKNSINYSASDANGVSKVYYRKGSSGDFSSVAGSTRTISADTGNNATWYFYAEDVAGNVSATVSCTLDTVKPTNSTLSQFTNTAISFNPTDTNGIAKVYYRKGASGNYSSTTAKSYTVSANETNNGIWYFYAEDVAGNTSAAVSCTLDTVKPTNTSLSEYTNKTISFNPTDTNGIAKIYYRKGSTGSYTSVSKTSHSISASEANNGIWYFYAEDVAGNTSAAASCTLDTIAPTVTSAPPSYTNTAISFVSSDANPYRVYYKFNDGAEVVSASTQQATIAATLENNGRWTLYAEDKAGNKTAEVVCIIDTVNPTGSTLSEFSKGAIKFSATDTNGIAKVYYRKGASGNYSSTTANSYTVSANETNNGIWYFYAEDVAGNKTTVASCTLDTIAPALAAVLPQFTNQNVTFVTTDTNSYRVYYKQNNGAYSYVASNQTTINATAGNNGTWSFYAEDKAGNVSATVSCTIDTVKPTFSALSAYTKTAINYSASDANGVSKVYYRKGSTGTFSAVDGSSHTISATSANNAVWYFYAEDVAGNVSVVTSSTLDTIAPTFIALPTFTNEAIEFKPSDLNAIVKTYYRKGGSGAYTELSASGHTVAANEANNGIWYFYAEDVAGNVSVVASSTLDTIAPTFAALPTFTNKAIEFKPSDLNQIVKTYYRKGGSGAYTELSASGHTVSANETNNGIWHFYAEDVAGNVSVVASSTLDTIAPTFAALPQITKEAISFISSDINSYRVFSSKDGADFVAVSSNKLTIDATVANNAVWRFYAEDAAGNVSTVASCTLDTIAPTFTALPNYTNQDIMFASSDLNGISGIYYRKGSSGAFVKLNDDRHTVSAESENNAVWYFYSEDIVGNKSAETSTVLCVVSTFGNKEQIFNSYKVTSWYRVTLPSRIFTTSSKDIAGSYTFATYEAALAYAIKVEEEFRCSVVPSGWIYVSASNESVSQIYESRAVLDAAILKYAKTYVSDKQTYSTGSNNYYTTVNGFEVDSTALTRQQLAYPEIMSAYADLPLYLASVGFSFTELKHSFANVAGSVTLTYISDGFQLKTQEEISLGFATPIKTALNNLDQLKQGYYLVTESDLAGNIEKYVIYIDLTAPSLTVKAENGKGSFDLTFNDAYVQEFAGTFYFTSFSLCSLLDNVDTDYSMIKITGTGIDKTYVVGDELPTLGGDYNGKYIITIYDRSKNTLSFEVILAGAAPSWTYTSLKSDVKLTLTFVLSGDRFNALTSLQLFKILSDGSYQEVLVDDNGVAVNTHTTQYTLLVGGKYTARMSDLFYREVEMKPIFFEKGLPSGSLSGVSDGGRTNKDVTFSYAAGNNLVVYIFENGEKRIFNGYTSEYRAVSNSYLVTFISGETTSFEYLLFLHTSYDIGLFIEYTFEIDCILSPVSIVTAVGELEPDSATNIPFSLTWQDSRLSVRYYSSNTPGGSIGESNYKNNTLIDVDGLYYFTVRDDVGNTMSFTIYIKTKIAYKIEGDYKTVDGRIISNKNLVVTVLDGMSSFEVENSKGNTFTNGSPIQEDGVYVLTVFDNYNNTLVLTIEIDTTPPIIELSGVEINGKTQGEVVFSASDSHEAYLTNAGGAPIRAIEQGETFVAHGKYYLKVIDLAGNVATCSFEIDLKLDYTCNVISGQITSRSVMLVLLETVQLIVKHNGAVVAEPGEVFVAVGTYYISAMDTVGNVLQLSFEIVPVRALSFSQTIPSGFEIVTAYKDGETYALAVDFEGNFSLAECGVYKIILSQTATAASYELDIEVDTAPPEAVIVNEANTYLISSFSKPGVTFTLSKDGAIINYDVGKSLSAPGRYLLTVVDDLGNANTYEFEIPYRLNTWAIVIITIGATLAVIMLIVFIRAKTKIKV